MMKTVDFAKEAMKSRQSHGIKGKENRPPQLGIVVLLLIQNSQ